MLGQSEINWDKVGNIGIDWDPKPLIAMMPIILIITKRSEAVLGENKFISD